VAARNTSGTVPIFAKQKWDCPLAHAARQKWDCPLHLLLALLFLGLTLSSLPALGATDDAGVQGPALTAPVQSTGKNGSTLKWGSSQAQSGYVNSLRPAAADERAGKVVQAAAFVPVASEPTKPVADAFGEGKKTPTPAPPAPVRSAPPATPKKADLPGSGNVLSDEGDAIVVEKCPEANDPKYFKPLREVNADIRPPKNKPEPGELPMPTPDESECKLVYKPPRALNAARLTDNAPWSPVTYTWKASALCHKPLYFEDVQLERYGHSAGPFLQPLASAAQFYLLVPALPYSMGVELPCECMYDLGYYRPGSCAPYMLDPIPLSVRAGLAEAGVVTGLIFAIP
jgi:hypothetical protein